MWSSTRCVGEGSASSAYEERVNVRRSTTPKLKATHTSPTPEEDAAILAGIAEDPDAFEITPELWKYMRPAAEVMPNFIKAHREGKVKLPENHKPIPVKKTVAVWLDEDVVAYYRAGGMDTWRHRVHEVLRKAMKAEQSKDSSSYSSKVPS